MSSVDPDHRELNYQLGYATELVRQIVAHFDTGNWDALEHSVEVTRRFLTEEGHTVSEPVYLYTYGRRRHIKDPNGTPSERPEFSAQAHCGGWFDTDERMAETLKWWRIDQQAVDEAMGRKRAEPVCKRCERLAARS